MRAIGRYTFGVLLIVIYCLELFWDDTAHYGEENEI